MKKYFYALFFICISFKVVTYQQLPDKVAQSFGGSSPTAWASKTTDLWMWIAVCLFMLVVFQGIILLLRKIPATLYNVPNKEFWTRPENYEKLVGIVSSFLYEIGAATYLFMTLVSWLVFRANMSNPVALDAPFLLLLLFIFFGYIAYAVYFRLVYPTNRKDLK